MDFDDEQAKGRLFAAAFEGDCDTLYFLLNERRVDVNARYNAMDYFSGLIGQQKLWPNGRTALAFAVLNNQIDAARLLIEHFQADADLSDVDEGLTPLHLASKLGNLEVARILVEDGNCDLESKERFQNHTPLALAVLSNHLEVAKYLISKGANVNVADVDRETPLDYAYRSPAMHQLLLSNGGLNGENLKEWNLNSVEMATEKLKSEILAIDGQLCDILDIPFADE